MNQCILGIDLGGTNIRVGLVDRDANLRAFEMSSTPEVLNDDPVNNLIAYIGDYLQRHLAGELPDAISIGVPSTISKDRRTILSTPNIESLNNVELCTLLEDEFATRIFLNRDVNLLMYYDLYHFELPLKSTTMACYFGTGLGNAILMDGKLHLGKNGVAAELGHIPIAGNHRLCGCGNVGCAETIASGRYLETLRDEYFAHTAISDLFKVEWPHPVLHEFVDHMASTVATEINILDPDFVILGGGILQMPDFPYDTFLAKIRNKARKPYPSETLEFYRSHQLQDNGVIGAGLYAIREIENIPPLTLQKSDRFQRRII